MWGKIKITRIAKCLSNQLALNECQHLAWGLSCLDKDLLLDFHKALHTAIYQTWYNRECNLVIKHPSLPWMCNSQELHKVQICLGLKIQMFKEQAKDLQVKITMLIGHKLNNSRIKLVIILRVIRFKWWTSLQTSKEMQWVRIITNLGWTLRVNHSLQVGSILPMVINIT